MYFKMWIAEISFFVMFQVQFWAKMWCLDSSMFGHSMFGVFEVRYFDVRSKTKLCILKCQRLKSTFFSSHCSIVMVPGIQNFGSRYPRNGLGKTFSSIFSIYLPYLMIFLKFHSALFSYFSQPLCQCVCLNHAEIWEFHHSFM